MNTVARMRFIVSLAAIALLSLLMAACSGGNPAPTETPSPAATSTATATALATATATASPTPSPTSTPSATPSPTAFVPPTVAVAAGDTVQSCLQRNLTPELLISLSKDDVTLANDIIRTCLETQLPAELVFLLNPIIDTTSACALKVSKTLTNEELFALAGPNGAAKDAIVGRVTNDILTCVAAQYNIPITLLQ